MQPILEIKAFFFNAQTDYLPYYKQFNIELTEEMTAKELLALIQAENEDFSYLEENLLFKINDLIVDADQNMSEVVERLGTTLKINPINAFRSMNGLIINEDDFMQSYEILAPFASEEDLAYYKTLYAVHYASETEKFDHEYIGDAVLLLAHKMISEGSEHKKEILAAITSVNSGLFDCEYENNFFHAQDHSAVISELKGMTNNLNKGISFDEIMGKVFGKKLKSPKASHEKSQNIAYYAGANSSRIEEINSKILNYGANIVSFARQSKLAGTSLINESKELAYRKAGTTLLDALDCGAQLLIVEDKNDFNMFNTYYADITKIMGRDIELSMILASDFDAFSQKNVAEEVA